MFMHALCIDLVEYKMFCAILQDLPMPQVSKYCYSVGFAKELVVVFLQFQVTLPLRHIVVVFSKNDTFRLPLSLSHLDFHYPYPKTKFECWCWSVGV